MKYAVEMGSGAMIYLARVINTGSGIQKLKGWGDIHRHRDRKEIAYGNFKKVS
jgi:hypothetical protein